VVGTSDSQTLVNKDLTSGTNSFPSSLATLTGAQTLTNKNLTDPSNTFPSTLVDTSTNQTVAGNKTLTGNTDLTGGSGATPSLLIAPTTDTTTLKIIRGTDTSPAQPLIQARDHANTGDAFLVGANGDITANSISCFLVTAKGATLGTFFGSDANVLDVRRGTDTSPTADVLTVRNNAGSTTYLKVDAAGDTTVQRLKVGTLGDAVTTTKGSTKRMHWGTYSGTTDASGFLTVTHGAGFTPSVAVASGAAPGSQFAAPDGVDSFTATTVRVRFFLWNTGGLAGSAAVTFHMFLGE
jgi:hypothetical protein